MSRSDFYPVIVFAVLAALSNAPRTSLSQGDAASKDTQDALVQTQDLLRDSNKRLEAIQNTPGADKTDKNLQAFTGSSASSDKIYNISADIMGKIVAESAGDAEKMQQMLKDFQSNPEAFYKKLDPSIQRDISSVAKEIEQNKKSRP